MAAIMPGTTSSRPSRRLTSVLMHLQGARGEFAQQLPVEAGVQSQTLGDRQYDLSVCDGKTDLFGGHQSGAMVGGLWQARAARGPPEVDHLVLELDASYMDSSVDSQDQAEPPELTYIDIDPFLESF